MLAFRLSKWGPTLFYWRKDLIEELASRQRDDGSWVNQNQQFFEGDAKLCTSFALLALSHAGPKKAK